MALALAGKTALITGGSKGIGAATSLLLAEQGANVAINFSSDAAAADALIAKTGAPERCIAVKGDAGSVPEIEKMVAATVEKFGQIDLLIPCAGILPMKDLEHTSEEDFTRTFDLNVKGPYFLAQVCICSWPLSLALRNFVESSASHAHRFPYRAILHIVDDCSHGQPSVPTLQQYQRRDRADDASSGQGSCFQGNQRQRCGARAHCNGIVSQRQTRGSPEGNFRQHPLWSSGRAR